MIDIKETFLKLTTRTYSNSSEHLVIDLLKEQYDFNEDEFGNYYIIVKNTNGTFSNTMFTCHLDTVHHTLYKNLCDVNIKHEYDGDFIKTNGNTNLGADDKAGVVIMLNMISENVSGLYYFFIGEETGRQGSSKLSKSYMKMVDNGVLPLVNRCISFDRSGYDMIITHQKNNRCCSDKFAIQLSEKLNDYGFWYKLDDRGGRTDSYQFMGIVSECTNISVGYFGEHTTTEKQDIEFLQLLAVVVTKIDWDNLIIERKPEKPKKPKTNNYTNNYTYNSKTKTYTYSGSGSVNSIKPTIEETDRDFDTWYHEQLLKTKETNMNDLPFN